MLRRNRPFSGAFDEPFRGLLPLSAQHSTDEVCGGGAHEDMQIADLWSEEDSSMPLKEIAAQDGETMGGVFAGDRQPKLRGTSAPQTMDNAVRVAATDDVPLSVAMATSTEGICGPERQGPDPKGGRRPAGEKWCHCRRVAWRTLAQHGISATGKCVAPRCIVLTSSMHDVHQRWRAVQRRSAAAISRGSAMA